MTSLDLSLDIRKIDIAVIGGGASGMVASIQAGRLLREKANGKYQIAIFERNDRMGKKLLMTGNGRCNLTNLDTDGMHFHGSDMHFPENILKRYPPTKIISFFEEMGVVCTEESGKIFPMSLHAGSVLDSLRLALMDLDIQVCTGAKVIEVKYIDSSYVLLFADGQVFHASAVIVATGGKSAPTTGSDGSGYSLLTGFSHKLVPTLPSIVQLKTDTFFCKPLSGNKVNGMASLFIDNIEIRKESGDILFTDYGLSGPPILQLSGYVSRALSIDLQMNRVPDIRICIDFLPDIPLEKVVHMLMTRKASFANRRLEDFLTGLFHKRLAVGLLRQITNKQLSAHVSSFSDKEILELAQICKSMSIRVTATMPFANAQTTIGGISTAQFDANTLSSHNAPGLFACGEILDIDGDCGGYNLQWAWASGCTAGISAAQHVLRANEL